MLLSSSDIRNIMVNNVLRNTSFFVNEIILARLKLDIYVGNVKKGVSARRESVGIRLNTGGTRYDPDSKTMSLQSGAPAVARGENSFRHQRHELCRIIADIHIYFHLAAEDNIGPAWRVSRE